MKKIFNFFRKDALLKGSLIVFIGSIITNLGTYLFHLAMGRMLGPADYGILESLISLSYFLGIPLSVLALVMVKYISQQNREVEKVSLFIKKIFCKISLYGLGVLLIFLLAFPMLKNLLKVNSFVLFLGLGIANYLSIYITIFSSALQGIMRFGELSFFSVFGSWSRLILSVLLVLFGLRVEGVIYAIVFSALLAVVLGYKMVRRVVPLRFKHGTSAKNPLMNMGSYSTMVFLSNLSLISFFTIDIILARHFLSPLAAGQYASLSVLGKIIFFASSPIVSVMFPMVSERHANGGKYQKLFISSFLMVLAISIFISAIYFIFPEIMVKILFGKEYLSTAASLGLFSVFISLYSLCSLLLNFYLSISRTKPIFLSLFFAVFQIALINIYHQTIRQIVFANIASLSLLLAGLLVYYLKMFVLRKNKN